jgi:hypothetical protein
MIVVVVVVEEEEEEEDAVVDLVTTMEVKEKVTQMRAE